MIIEDGLGSGQLVGVSQEGRLFTYSVTESEMQHVNENHGEAYSVVFDVTPDANSTFFYLRNDSNYELFLNSFYFYTTDSTAVEMILYGNTTGTVTGGNVITASNRHIGAGNAADATIYYGSSLSGLTNGRRLIQFLVTPNNSGLKLSIGSKIIVNKNRVVSFYAITGGVPISCNICFYYHFA